MTREQETRMQAIATKAESATPQEQAEFMRLYRRWKREQRRG